MKGGPGDDAISGGAGPFDLLQGNEGNDYIVAGPDESEVFGGPGNDIIYMGRGLSESVGGAGDDWMEGTDSPASIAIGDDNNQFQNDPNGGHDILLAGPGDMDFDSEGGDDIMVGTVVPTHRFEGMLGFDWATYRGETRAVDADMLITGATVVNAPLNEGRDRYDLLEALSGTNFNDVLRGDNRLEADLRDDGLTGVVNAHVLTQAGINRITGLAAILPAGATEFAGGNIILGGPGSDLLEGRAGNDILDGDRWLNVQLRGVLTGGAVVLANSLHQLRADVFANPQRLSPSNITFVREIVLGAAAVDTAVFTGPRADYTVTGNSAGGGVVTVTDNVGTDGTDTLRNIEALRFADVIEAAPGANIRIVPPVTGLTETAALLALAVRNLTATVTTANSNTVAAGLIISQDPPANTAVAPNSAVALVRSLGPVDTTAPTVALVNPPAGNVTGTITVSATANDNVAVVGVLFLLDGTPLGTEDTTPPNPFTVVWNTSTAAPGPHTLQARARDAAGNIATTAIRNVNVTNDATLPTVSITAPLNGATVSGANVTVSANASDDVGVVGVQFFRDANVNIGAEDTVAPYSVNWSTIGLANGNHTLNARARDAAGNTATATITVNVNNVAVDNTPPTITLGAAPAANATVSGNVTLTATANDNIGVVGVQFLLDGVALGAEDTTPPNPFSVVWNTTLTPNGPHTIAARARDAAGNTATTANRTVNVSNAVGGLPTGLVAAFNFDAVTAGTVTNAANPTLNGTVSGAVLAAAQVGFGNSLQFDGVNDLVTVADANSLDLTTGMTLSAWVNPTALAAGGGASGWRTVVLKERGTNGLAYSLYANDGPVNRPAGYARIGAADQQVGAAPVLPLNTWTHIAVVKDGAGLRLYVNGVLRATNNSGNATGAITATAQPLRIGGSTVFPQEWFAGRIDDVRVYNRALSLAEINTDRTTRLP
jgi:hypothetical protein